jgi:MFS family permease
VSLRDRGGPLRERDFRLLWTGRTISELGSGLVPVALTFAVLDLSRSATSLGLVLTAAFVPRVVLLLPGGVFADRVPRQLVVLATDLLRAASQALVAFLLLSGHAELWQLILLFVIYGAADAFFSPASTGLVPDVVSSERFQQANALLSLSASVALIAGPALAGVLVTAWGPGVVFAVDAGTFAVSSLALALLGGFRRRAAIVESSVGADLKAGWHEVIARTWVWTSIAYFSLSNLAVAPLFVLGPVVANESLGGPEAWGLILTGAGIGSLLGDAAALVLRPRHALTPGYLALATWSLAPVLLAHRSSPAAIAAAGALGFAALSFSNALWLTTLHERIPRGSLSRVSAYDWLGSRLFQPIGYALAGPVGAAIGIPATLIAGAALHASASVAVALSPAIRKVHRLTPLQQPAGPLAVD